MRLLKGFRSILRSMRIAPKIFLLTLVCFESLTLLMAYSFNRHSSGILVETQMEHARQTLEKSNRYLDLNLQNIRLTMSAIANDNRLQNGQYAELERWMANNLIYLTPNFSNIHVATSDEVLASTSAHRWDLQSDPVVSRIVSGKQDNSSWIGPYHSKVSGYTLTYVTSARLGDGRLCYLLADVNLERLYYSIFPDDPTDMAFNLMLLDERMKPVYGRAPYVKYDYIANRFDFDRFDPGLLRINWTQTETGDPGTDDRIVWMRGYNSTLRWQMLTAMNKSELLAPLAPSIRYSWLLACLSFLLAIALSLLIAALVSRPIKRITRSIQEVGDGNFSAHIPVGRKDELGYLALHFNLMTRKIGQLLVDLKSSEEQKKRADFRALHAQIKPHYLYNTLNTISMLGRRGDAERADRLISALTNQLHYALDQSPDPVTLREELLALAHYSELMTIRYPDKCRFETEIDPLSLEYKLPKFILQPLVENAIFHGIVPREEGGTVYVSTMVDERFWEILIEDDGVGMPAATLDRLRAKIERGAVVDDPGGTGGHIGLANVNERFRLMFGDAYAMRTESEPRMGTRIWIKLPKDGSAG